MPTQIGRAKQTTFSHIMDKIRNKLKGWKEKKLSFAGRGVLISAVVQALPTYMMSCFLLPKALCDKIEKAICRFWWGNSDGTHKLHWKARKDLFKAKYEGGLGFRDMHLFNKAMLAKQVWRLKTDPHSLLSQCIKAKYYPHSDIFQAHQGNQASYAWQSIHQAIGTIKRGSCWKIGNGQSINIWEDNWLVWQNGFRIHTPYNGHNNINTVSDIMLSQPYNRWNDQLIDSIFMPMEGEFIKQTPLILEPIEDQLMWPHTKQGSYTVKSGYNLLVKWHNVDSPSSTSTANNTKFRKKLWSLPTIPRHKALIWRIIQRAIPVRSELNKRGIPCPVVCPRCFQQEESIDHTFMHCPRANKIWFGSRLGIHFNRSHASFIDWLIHAISSLCPEDIIYLAAITYSIWFARNQHIFELKDTPDLTVIEKASKSIIDFQLATGLDQSSSSDQIGINNNQNTNYQRNTRSTQWTKPMPGTIKINCDANLSKYGRWGLGATCRDSDGVLVAAATWESPGPDDPTLAEACAVYQAVQLARDCCFQDVIFESDISSIISLINATKALPKSYVGNLVWGINCKSVSFRSCMFRHISRKANGAAHLLASLAHLEPNKVWIEDTPLSCICLAYGLSPLI
jgi:hypothetical protein